MRYAALVLLFAAVTIATNAQFAIRPQAGVENSNTKISYNSLGYFSPIKQLQPQLGVLADYKFRSGFGPFIGLLTNRSTINYNFNDPESGMNTYRASWDKMQLQLQGGLQYTTKPIFFKKSTNNKSSQTVSSAKRTGRCNHYSTNCYQRKSGTAQKAKSQNKGWSVALRPSAGFAYAPSDRPDLAIKSSAGQNEYAYHAGNNKTTLLTGLGFQFARNRTRLFDVNINYFKGLGNNETIFTSQTGGKTITTVLNSKLSGWTASIGIPINLSKKTSTKSKSEEKTKYDCQQYRMKCRSRCIKVI